MEIFSLRSGSRGNATLLYSDKTKILIDCGISGKTAEMALAELDVSPTDLDAIVITHEHIDHIMGVGVMMRRYNLPVWANEATWSAMENQVGKIPQELIKTFNIGDGFEIGNIGVSPFSIPHDAASPVGYSFLNAGEKVSVVTDIGELKKDLFAAAKGSKTVLLESNHDVNMLEISSYPINLKQRIRGKLGHLSNDEAGKAAEFLVKLGTENIILGHLSEENNYPELAFQTVVSSLKEVGIRQGIDVNIDVARRDRICSISA